MPSYKLTHARVVIMEYSFEAENEMAASEAAYAHDVDTSLVEAVIASRSDLILEAIKARFAALPWKALPWEQIAKAVEEALASFGNGSTIRDIEDYDVIWEVRLDEDADEDEVIEDGDTPASK
ncbi:MAG: hypothetical protein Q8R28_15140 [Dehalococcoidia bacterium]|nr:hypothetical protein [Dehalococcoidia bacterium]